MAEINDKADGAMDTAILPSTVETSAYTYIGPDYRNAIFKDGQPWRPKLMSDAQIEQLFENTTWAKEWFSKVS
jgi:hypothetical protein